MKIISILFILLILVNTACTTTLSSSPSQKMTSPEESPVSDQNTGVDNVFSEDDEVKPPTIPS